MESTDSRSCFTPASARAALVQVRPVAEDICRLYRLLETRRPTRVDSDQRVVPQYFMTVRRLHGLIESLDRKGIRVKDPKRGLLDFPARLDGRNVLLCWKVGEPTLLFWHEPNAGFAGRRPVDEHAAWTDVPDLTE